MERLTERTAVGILVKENYEKKSLKTLYSCYGEKPNSYYSNCEEGYCAMEKLADYEDAEEQGRLFKLPCMDKFLESVSNQDFDRRISEVVEMLEEKQLYGTISLIKDLKYYLDLAIEEKAHTCNCQRNSNSIDNEPCCRCDSKHTNADRIRNMSDEEMAERIASSSNFNCADYCDSFQMGVLSDAIGKKEGLALVLNWLQSEAE